MTLLIGWSQFSTPPQLIQSDGHARRQPSRQPLLITGLNPERLRQFGFQILPSSCSPSYVHICMARKDLAIIDPVSYAPGNIQQTSGFGHCVMRLEAVVNDGVRIVGYGSGEQLRCDHYRGEQIDKGYANPHQGARRFLVLER